MKIPEGYNSVMPYLIVADPQQLMDFMKTVLGAKEKMLVPNDAGGIMHAEVFIGDSVIMFAGSSEQYPTQTAGMFVYVQDADVAYRLALENGATSVMEPRDQDYGRSGGVVDPQGNTWWITSTL